MAAPFNTTLKSLDPVVNVPVVKLPVKVMALVEFVKANEVVLTVELNVVPVEFASVNAFRPLTAPLTEIVPVEFKLKLDVPPIVVKLKLPPWSVSFALIVTPLL